MSCSIDYKHVHVAYYLSRSSVHPYSFIFLFSFAIIYFISVFFSKSVSFFLALFFYFSRSFFSSSLPFHYTTAWKHVKFPHKFRDGVKTLYKKHSKKLPRSVRVYRTGASNSKDNDDGGEKTELPESQDQNITDNTE